MRALLNIITAIRKSGWDKKAQSELVKAVKDNDDSVLAVVCQVQQSTGKSEQHIFRKLVAIGYLEKNRGGFTKAGQSPFSSEALGTLNLLARQDIDHGSVTLNS